MAASYPKNAAQAAPATCRRRASPSPPGRFSQEMPCTRLLSATMVSMDIEVFEVVDFLAQHAPFDALPDADRAALARSMRMQYFRRGSVLLAFGAVAPGLFMIRSGAVDLTDRDGLLIDRNAPGDTFGSLSAMGGQPSTYTATAIEDTLVLILPGAQFVELFQTHQQVADHFTPRQRGRLRRATEALHTGVSPIVQLRAEDLITRPPVTASPTISIQEAAQTMTSARVSALLLTDEHQRLCGIVTDRDLRSRVVLTGTDVHQPIATVMTARPATVAPDAMAFELLMVMTQQHVHHLPVIRDGEVLGLVSAGDIMRLETSNPVYLVGDISKQTSVDGLADVTARRSKLAAQLLARGATADEVSVVLTTVADAATTRLIELAEDELGTAPHPWCWVSLGSQARRELALGSDQDHAIIVADSASDLAWYRAVAERVTAGLERCGYPRCAGDTMATRWCMPLAEWTQQMRAWVAQPTSEAVLHSQIFFDMHPVHGDEALYTALRKAVWPQAASSQRFLGHLATMAVRREPPLGFFRGFVVERSGEHEDRLDIKAGGIHAVIELVRVLALAQEITANTTLARIEAIQAAGQLTAEQATELTDAFSFMQLLRLRRHIELATRDEQPDNFIAPEALTAAERRHLREAFAVVKQAQQTLAYQFRTHLLQ